MPHLQVDPRFHGPPNSANGGYVCGLVASLAAGPVEVSLRLPPPLGRPMPAEVTADGGVRVHDGAALIVDAVPASQPHLDLDVPGGVDLEAAQVASRGYTGFDQHPFPTCWTCGPDRQEGDGLRIFTGPVAGLGSDVGLVAGTWVPHEELDAGDGNVAVPHVWAALDCPTYFGSASPEPALLARLRADQRAPIRVGQPYVVLGWTTASPEGRKRHGGAAVLGGDGEVLAVSAAIWVTLSAEALASLLDPSPAVP
jgi:hypothetical protein